MLFLGKKTDRRPAAQDPRAKPDSGFKVSSLFDLDIGGTIRPLAETGKIFVGLLATIFAANGLFPKNHPALRGDENAPLYFGEVMGTAWRNVRFTREGLPQALLFVAVAMSIVLSALALVMAGIAAISGHAHAQTATGSTSCANSSMFQPCDSTQDIAIGWINYIFFGTPMNNYLDQYGQQVPQSNYVQQALTGALGFYSDAILIVAAIVLFYHLASMVVETAHHGVVMGKRANQVWAPIRLVVAIGLLVPISGGLNSGQYVVIQIAKWGSGLASQVWGRFADAMAQENYTYVMPNAPLAQDRVAAVTAMEACTYAYNQILNQEVLGAAVTGGVKPSDQPITDPPAAGQPVSGSTDIPYSYTPGSSGSGSTQTNQDLCGSYTMRGIPSALSSTSSGNAIETQIAQSTQQVAQQTFTTMQTAAQQFAQQNMPYWLPEAAGGKSGDPIPPNSAYDTLVYNYQDNLQQQSQQAMSNLQNPMTSVAQTAAAQGWVTAGAWFNTIARIQGDMMTWADMMPAVQPPDAGKQFAPGSLEQQTMDDTAKFMYWLGSVQENASSAQQTAPSSDSPSVQMQQALTGMRQQNEKSDVNPHWLDTIFTLVDIVAIADGVWTPASNDSSSQTSGSQTGGSSSDPNSTSADHFSLGVQFKSANPFAEIAALGHANINTAYDMFDIYLTMQAGGGIADDVAKISASMAPVLGKLAGPFAGLLSGLANVGAGMAIALGGLFGMISLVFFTAGFTLAYFLPMIPFFKFLFGIISWFVSLIEAIVCMPLVALAHLNPEGDGLPGNAAKGAYFFLFQIFLRPVMMVFGLITGILLFFLAASAVNMMYATAVVGAGGFAHGHMALARIVSSLLYVIILYMCANNVFKMVQWLPEQCIKWMGQQGLPHAQMGDAGDIAPMMTGAAGLVDQKIVSSTGEFAKNAGPAALLSPDIRKGMENSFESAVRLAEKSGGLSKSAGDKMIGQEHKAMAGLGFAQNYHDAKNNKDHPFKGSAADYAASKDGQESLTAHGLTSADDKQQAISTADKQEAALQQLSAPAANGSGANGGGNAANNPAPSGPGGKS